MANHVFVSYAQPEAARAHQLCAMLEAHGLACWIAPRNIPKGTTWASAIVTAIQECQALVVLLSAAANESRQVAREVDLADNLERRIIPIRVEPIEPAGDLRYLLGNRQWTDAFGAETDAAEAEVLAALEVPSEIRVGKTGRFARPRFVTVTRFRLFAFVVIGVSLGLAGGWLGAQASARSAPDTSAVEACYTAQQRLLTLSRLPEQSTTNLARAIEGGLVECTPMFNALRTPPGELP